MPKKAKRGGAGKGGGKMEEEERLVYLQQRAQAEEEVAKKKEEILSLFLKDKLQKEERNTAVNLLKLNEGWRSILRQTRAAELRKDIDVLGQTFQRQLDGLDNVSKNLDGDLREAERQSAQARRVHLQNLERLWAQQDKRLKFLQQQWEQGLQQLSSRFQCESKEMLEHSQQQQDDMEDAQLTLEQQHKEAMDEIHQLYSESVASYQSAHEERRAALVLEAELRLQKKNVQHQAALQLHNRETKELDDLVRRNQRYIQEIDENMRKVKELQDSVLQLRAKLNSSKTEQESAERDLTAARNDVNRETHELRDQLTRGQSAARKQILDLTVQSDSATKRLRAVIDKGEGVLRIAEMCRKLESEQENVLTPAPTAADYQRSATEEEATKATSEFPELQQVTRRLNAALLRREALKRERRDLSRENQQLRLLLRQHLDAMTVSDRALLAAHRAPTTTAPRDADRRHVVIEAAHAAKHSL